MKLSQLIERAQFALKEVGDLDVGVLTDTPDGLFCFDFEPWCDVLAVQTSEYEAEEKPCFAIAWGSLQNPGDEETEPEPQQQSKSKKAQKPDKTGKLKSV